MDVSAHAGPRLSPCRRCGLLATGKRCAECKDAVLAEPISGALPPEVSCAVVFLVMPCRVCGLDMPVNHLPVDGKLRCLHCGRVQAVDEDLALDLIETAHAVVDLAGESGPYEHVGVHVPTAREAVEDGELVVGRGLPRCALCEGAVTVTLPQGERGVARSNCAECGDEAEFAVRLAQNWGGLVGVLASEHRRDRAPAQRSEAGQVVALSCPKCGGPLDPKLDRHIVVCSFCDTKSVILEESWALLKGPVERTPWYLLFRGPSKLRQRLERETELRRRRQQAQLEARLVAEGRYPKADGGTSPSWFQRHYVNVAIAATVLSGAIVAGAVGVGWHHFGSAEVAPALGLGSGFVAMLLGIPFYGKGKTSAMSPKAAVRVLQIAAVCVAGSLCALLVLLTLAPSGLD